MATFLTLGPLLILTVLLGVALSSNYPKKPANPEPVQQSSKKRIGTTFTAGQKSRIAPPRDPTPRDPTNTRNLAAPSFNKRKPAPSLVPAKRIVDNDVNKIQRHLSSMQLEDRDQYDEDIPLHKLKLGPPKPSKVGGRVTPNLWTEFITLCGKYAKVNLGQGFPNMPIMNSIARDLAEVAKHPEMISYHQYARGYGYFPLAKALADYYSVHLNHKINPETEVLTTVGAYLGLYYSFIGWINPGDRVIVFEPAYDSYIPQIEQAGGIVVPILLKFDENDTEHTDNGFQTSGAFKFDLKELEAAVTADTKMIVINNPNNPTGKLFTREELEAIAKIVRLNPQLLVVADEVYEFHVYPTENENKKMHRFASLRGMFDRTITIGSAGKAFSVTGWKVGWVFAPEHILQPLKMVHENCVFTTASITQHVVAKAFEYEVRLRDEGRLEESFLSTIMGQQLVKKRDELFKRIAAAGFTPILPEAGYFIMADFSAINGDYDSPIYNTPFEEKPDAVVDETVSGANTPRDYKFVRWMLTRKVMEKRQKWLKEHPEFKGPLTEELLVKIDGDRKLGLGSIPPSAFYSLENKRKYDNDRFVRFMFYKDDDTLQAAYVLLKELKKDSLKFEQEQLKRTPSSTSIASNVSSNNSKGNGRRQHNNHKQNIQPSQKPNVYY